MPVYSDSKGNEWRQFQEIADMHGPLSDHQIRARRRDLRRLGLIQPCGWILGPYGVKNCMHGLLDNDR